jgi:maltose alpha-D-glucosyltransferase/alpha-amylase
MVEELVERSRNEFLTAFPVYHAEEDWHQKAVIYSLYADLYAGHFKGLTRRLDYLSTLGVNTVWLLPVLKSPMRDYGFDVENYFEIREDLLSSGSQEEFYDFIREAHMRGIRLIFDVPLGHCSDQHEYFQDVLKSGKNSPWYDYFIWNKDEEKYKDCRILFKGMMTSNWEYKEDVGEYFFHRFYDFQPDWNYRNPKVLLQAISIFAFWKNKGIDGFRLDAIPFLWKEEGTDCENLPQTHTIVKLIRAVLDAIAPGSLLLAEACQPPAEVVRYFGSGDEVSAAYHFPLMPQIYNSLAKESSSPIQEVLDERNTPAIPDGCSWFTFLRCHDELTLEFVTPEDRAFLHWHYCHDSRWDFRQGEGISARLRDLMKGDVHKILLAYSILLTLEGSPIFYYGDEFGQSNDEDFFNASVEEVGYADSRNFVRGPVDWPSVRSNLKEPNSLSYTLFHSLKDLIFIRQNRIIPFKSAAEFEWLHDKCLCYKRQGQNDKEFWFVHNLSAEEITVDLTPRGEAEFLDLTTGLPISNGDTVLGPYRFLWLVTVS